MKEFPAMHWMHRTLVVFMLGVSLMTGCNGGDSSKSKSTDADEVSRPAPKPLLKEWETPAVAFVFSGRQHGYLEPCGCSETQSGGLARRHDLFKQVRKRGWTTVGLDVGGAPRPERGSRQQEQLKFQSLLSGLQQMDYRSLALGVEEVALGPDQLLSLHLPDESVPFLGANIVLYETPDLGTPLQQRVLEFDGVKVGVTGVLSPKLAAAVLPRTGSTDLVVKPPEEVLPGVLEYFEAESVGLRILLAHVGTDEALALAKQFPEFDVIVTAGGPEDPDGEPTREGDTWILQVGIKGKNVGVLGYYPDVEPRFRFELVNLDKDRFHETEEMRELMRAYQQTLVELDVIGNSQPVAHPSGNTYLGAESCKDCHEKAWNIWSKSPHARAYEILAKGREGEEATWISRIHDPECLACHTTGWDPQQILRYDSGFTNLEQTPHLAGQQCENCHGPGSRHAELELAWVKDRKSVDEQEVLAVRGSLHLVEKTADKQVCSKCHDSDNSPHFEFKKYWEKVRHSGKN